MSAKTRKDPKVLTPWAPFDVPTKIAEWLAEHKSTDKLEWDGNRGRFVHTVKTGPGAWAEVATYGSQREFAIAQGLIGPRDA